MSEIDDLVATVADLEQRVAALEGRPAPAPKNVPVARAEEGAQILTGAAAHAYFGKRPMPSGVELRQLRAIVDEAYPSLKFVARNEFYADADAAEDCRGFAAAFAYLAEQGRTDRIDTGKTIGWHIDGANSWVRETSRESGQINGRNFLAALVAHGDFLFTPLDAYPAIGLTIGGAGRQYAEKWRDVLAGCVPTPVAKPASRGRQ